MKKDFITETQACKFNFYIQRNTKQNCQEVSWNTLCENVTKVYFETTWYEWTYL